MRDVAEEAIRVLEVGERLCECNIVTGNGPLRKDQ